MKKLYKFWPYLIYLALVFVIMWPLYKHGFVFLLDMVFTPKIDLSDFIAAGVPAHFPIILIIKVVSFILPVAVIQKILLSLLLFLPGVFMYRLTQFYLAKHWAFFAGLLYMLNPWTYERFLSGHWYVYLGYAIFPLFISFSHQLFDSWKRKDFIKWLSIASIYPIINLHFSYLAFGFFFIYFLVFAIQHREKLPSFRKITILAVIAGAVILLINSFWLVNYLKPDHDYMQITFEDFRAYPTASDERIGIYSNVLALYGFWDHNHALPKDIYKWWWVPSLGLVLLFIIGTVSAYRSRISLLFTVMILFVPLYIVALGVSTSISEPVVNFLYDYLPGFKGLRETTKLIGLMAFAYALIIPLGAKAISEFISLTNKSYYKLIYVCFLFLPLFTVFSATSGFMGQVKSTDYPKSWYEANQKLSDDSSVSKVLFLPWFAYLHFPFVGDHLVVNPAPRFFDKPLLYGKNIENLSLPDYKETELDIVVREFTEKKQLSSDHQRFLKEKGVTHIIVVEEENSEHYHFLEHERDRLELYYEQPDFIIYKLK